MPAGSSTLEPRLPCVPCVPCAKADKVPSLQLCRHLDLSAHHLQDPFYPFAQLPLSCRLQWLPGPSQPCSPPGSSLMTLLCTCLTSARWRAWICGEVGRPGLGSPTLRVPPRLFSATHTCMCPHTSTQLYQTQWILPLVVGRAGPRWMETMRTFRLLSASDYVCVLDIDLLELVIKTWKGSTEGRLVSLRPPGEL